MKIVFTYQGRDYFMEHNGETTPEVAAKEIYEQIRGGVVDTLKIGLEGGGFLVMGKEAINGGVFHFIPEAGD